MNADGSGRRHPTSNRISTELGTWSPNGRVLFYTRLDASGNLTSWAMNADGSGNRRFRGFEEAFQSPDGDHVVGIRNSGVESDYYGSPDLYMAKSNGDDGRWLTRIGDAELFGWSPDGEWILYKRRLGAAGLYIVKPNGSGRKSLTRSDDYGATWSPDGRFVLYTAKGIYVVARIGGPPRRLTRSVHDLSASWSRGGTRIVFARSFGIWTVNRNGTGLRPVARPRGAPVYESPAWSPSCG
jgi:Tol biopolymer transport system component